MINSIVKQVMRIKKKHLFLIMMSCQNIF